MTKPTPKSDTVSTGASREKPARKASGSRRSAARLAAVQALYQIDLSGGEGPSVVREFTHHRIGKEIDGQDYIAADPELFADIVNGVLDRRQTLDPAIAAALTPDWPLDRLEIILRAILRAGCYELTARIDVPVRVILNEYVEVAHAFFAGKEPALVNGVLDRLAQSLRPAETRSGEGSPTAERN
jgi:N utilization substance protein B